MFSLLLTVLLGARTLLAQTSSGAINGVVLDPSGAVVPGALVRLIGAETGDLVRELTTGPDGNFSAPLLRPSIYTIEVSAPGFKRLVRSGVSLRVDDVLALRLTLETGSTSESITVTADAGLLEEKSNTIGQVIEERRIQQLPLNGRNYLDLGNLTAGAVPSTRSRDRSFSAYGNRGLQNAFLLDGARNQNYLRGLDNRARDAMRPSLEAISEFKVQTSNYSAEYGASAGAVVNVVTKSGTNELHGSAFEFFRNNKMDARDYFIPPTATRPLYLQHQFGGALGGPFVKNRAWWHGAFQRTHISEGDTGTATVPLTAERNGVFGLPIYDPATTRANPAGSGFIRDLFPNNIIPTARFDRTGKSLVDRYPDPNLGGTARNWVSNPLQATRINNATIRGDYSASPRDTIFLRFSFDDGNFARLPVLPVGAQTGVNRQIPARSWGAGYTRILRPNIVNELRFAYNQVGVVQDATLPKDEILVGSLAPGINSSIPIFTVNGYATLGEQPPNFGNNPLDKKSKVWNLSDNLSLVQGKHTVKLGFDFQYLDIPTFAALQGRGSFNFSGVFTQNPQRRPGTGSSVADLLLGLPNSITIGTPSLANERARNYYLYVQDDWNFSSALTISVGIRYEITAPFWDANGRLANLVLSPGPLFGQYVIAGDSRLPRALQTLDRNNFAPRFGLAWRAPRALVVRAGYGVFFAQDEGFGVSQRMTNNPPFVGFGGYNIISDQTFLTSTISLSGTLPARPAPIDPSNYRLDPRGTVQVRSWPTRNTIPYVQQWSLSLQKELARNLVWEVNYVGNLGTKLYGAYEGNQPVPGPGAVNPRRPYAGVLTSGSILAVEPWVTSVYHGVSSRLERRFSNGLTFLAAYTFGRAIDGQSNIDLCDGCTSAGSGSVVDTRNRRLNRGLSDHHVSQRLVFSGLYDLPFGKGRMVASSGLAAAILGDWSLSGITTLSSGLPFTLTLNFDNANTGSANWPNRVASGKLGNPSADRWFDVAAFVFPAQFVQGNAGRNILFGPGVVSTDLGLFRTFRIPQKEGLRAEFRAEAFNLLNTPQLGTPGSVLGNPNFGVIGGTARPNRQLQLGLKILF
ncbi:MAG: TonB-dependent receptor [Bryobacteraceae bacterium]|nr:TonB-dependent receptor [Bryobacteraceae bacterium]MDW8376795.1 carboxypeptidase regulatory-like domain-containing protein [Bryobacterales bacterium]